MREIELTQGKVALVDDEEFESLSKYSWHTANWQNRFYAVRSQYNPKDRKIRQHFMHRHVLGEPVEGLEIDHIDGNGLNNQRSNLRFVTHRQNIQNRKNQKLTSNYPGVSRRLDSKKNPWQAQLSIKGEHIHLGLFPTERKAFEAYQKTVRGLGEEVIGYDYLREV